MADFNPDEYLAAKATPFDPDSYLAAKGPQWSDLPGNAVAGIKEAPQTALGLANQAKTGYDLINPAAYVNSAVQAASGTPLADTDTGKAIGAVGAGLSHTVDSIKGIPDVLSHPGQSAKNEIIEHPIGTAANVAGAAMGLGAGEAALNTGAEYAGRFGENQAVKALGRVPPGMSADAARELARRAAKDYGLLDETMGPIGRKATVDSMREAAGHEIGDIRDAASANGPAMSGEDMANAIRERLKDSYSEGGTNFDQQQALERELANIQAMKDTTPSDFAARASEINQKAKGKGFALPTNVDTDVSGAMSHINDESMAKIAPDQAEQYGKLNQTFGDMKDLGNMIERGEKRGLNQRGGNTLYEAGTKFMDELGAHKTSAKVGFAAESALDAASQAARPMGVAAITTNIMQRITSNPQSLGKYAAPLMQAAQGGPQGIAATHYVLSLQHPEYNQMWQDEQK